MFATRSELAYDIITTSVAAGVPARWVAADEAYGDNIGLRIRLRELRLGYVLAVFPDPGRTRSWHNSRGTSRTSPRSSGSPGDRATVK